MFGRVPWVGGQGGGSARGRRQRAARQQWEATSWRSVCGMEGLARNAEWHFVATPRGLQGPRCRVRRPSEDPTGELTGLAWLTSCEPDPGPKKLWGSCNLVGDRAAKQGLQVPGTLGRRGPGRPVSRVSGAASADEPSDGLPYLPTLHFSGGAEGQRSEIHRAQQKRVSVPMLRVRVLFVFCPFLGFCGCKSLCAGRMSDTRETES
ncbi:hypothetical protein BD289DRAFT_126739 [Coniella lustricola]|uniref:Uncharacterized protein n=1 Tax=Coniella lustricola TaxID=2025994 RepID=A0A2T2ZW93_9PEZI|nr:hypothetical protein BD289DRAFT_126739 [Coniella lustricola]